MDIKPGEFVMRSLFADFTIQAERKIEAVMSEPLVSNCFNLPSVFAFFPHISKHHIESGYNLFVIVDAF